MYYLNFADLNLYVNGATRGKLTKSSLNSIEIPLPPLPIQERIAAILDAADALRQKDQALLKKYNDLTQSLFLDMFGDPVTNPMGWEKIEFNKGIDDIKGGVSLGGEERQIENDELGVLKISAVTSGYFNANKYKVVDKFQIKKELVMPRKGDLLFSRANTREMVGAVAIVDKDYDYLFLPDKLWRLSLSQDILSTYFVKFILSHEGFRNSLRKLATGTSGSMLNISKAKLLSLHILCPDIKLQNQFAESIKAIEKQKEQVQANIRKSEDLFQSLLQRAFKGGTAFRELVSEGMSESGFSG